MTVAIARTNPDRSHLPLLSVAPTYTCPSNQRVILPDDALWWAVGGSWTSTQPLSVVEDPRITKTRRDHGRPARAIRAVPAAHPITYLYTAANAADQKIGRDVIERYTVLRKALDACKAELDQIVGPAK